MEPLNVVGDDLLAAMQCLDVIHMLHEGELLAANQLVGNTGVIWVELETNAMDIGDKMLVIEQCGSHYAIHGI